MKNWLVLEQGIFFLLEKIINSLKQIEKISFIGMDFLFLDKSVVLEADLGSFLGAKDTADSLSSCTGSLCDAWDRSRQ